MYHVCAHELTYGCQKSETPFTSCFCGADAAKLRKMKQEQIGSANVVTPHSDADLCPRRRTADGASVYTAEVWAHGSLQSLRRDVYTNAFIAWCWGVSLWGRKLNTESCSRTVCVCARTYLVIRSDKRPQLSPGVISICKQGTKRGSSGRLLQECCTFSLQQHQQGCCCSRWRWGIGLPISTLFLESTAKW